MRDKAFKFKLQNILELKEKIEAEEKEKLAKLNYEKAREEMVREQLKNLKKQTQVEFKEKQGKGTLNIEELKRYEAHLKKLDFLIENQNLRIKELEIKIQQQMEVVIKATQERKIFEKLKEKHKEKFLIEQDLEERKFIDELATSRYSREKEG